MISQIDHHGHAAPSLPEVPAIDYALLADVARFSDGMVTHDMNQIVQGYTGNQELAVDERKEILAGRAKDCVELTEFLQKAAMHYKTLRAFVYERKLAAAHAAGLGC